jgi:hypothetical protein
MATATATATDLFRSNLEDLIRSDDCFFVYCAALRATIGHARPKKRNPILSDLSDLIPTRLLQLLLPFERVL